MQGASPLASPGLGGARHWRRGRTTRPAGGVPGWLPAYPAFALLSYPYPPDPLPGGKGETKVISCKGLRPLHPGAGRGAALGKGANHAPGGGACPLQGGVRGHPGARRGACPVGCPLTLPLACFSAPYPPTPFPVGKGETKVISCKGLRPLHPRGGLTRAALGKGANHAPGGGRAPYRAGLGEHPGARRGACPVGRLPTLPLLYFLAPYPPVPLPGGKGETKVILCKGLRPLHPRGWAERGTGKGGEPRARRGACPLQGGVMGHPGARRGRARLVAR